MQWSRLPLPAQRLALAMLVMSLAVLLPLPMLRGVIVLPIALLAPGYAALLAAFGPHSWRDPLLALGLGVLLSMAIYPLLAMVLYILLIPYSTLSMVISIDLVVGLLVGVIVRRTAPSAGVFDADVSGGANAVGVGVPLMDTPWAIFTNGSAINWPAAWGIARYIALLGAAVAVLGVALRVLPTPVDAPFTQFYLTGRWSQISTIEAATLGRPLSVTIGITNHTHYQQTYRIVPRLDGIRVWHTQEVTLQDDQNWSGTVSGVVPVADCVHHLSIDLNRLKGTNTIGSLSVWVRGASKVPESCQTVATQDKP